MCWGTEGITRTSAFSCNPGPHILDLPIWAMDLGFPLNTSSSGGRFIVKDDGDAYDHHEVLWQYLTTG